MTDVSLVKYMVKLKFEVDGVVEKADIIGAIFGQTEGLFGPRMNLNELQKSGKVGRIEVSLKSEGDKSYGEVLVPMSTNISTVALIAAAIESVDKVGPCIARFSLIGIEDTRAVKRRQILERAKEILKEWASKVTSEGEEALQELTEVVRRPRVVSYGKEGLPAGNGVFTSDLVYVVEGRADVISLLKAGIDNVVAIEGTSIPESIVKLSKEKRLVAFLDGDRAGDLIQRELEQVARLEGVIRAPSGKEVEELTPIEIHELIREYERGHELPGRLRRAIEEIYGEINGTLEAVLLDRDYRPVKRLPISELVKELEAVNGIEAVIFDGIVTKRLVELAKRKGIKALVAHRMGGIGKRPEGMIVTTFRKLGLS